MKKVALISLILLVVFTIMSKPAQTQRTMGHDEWVAKRLTAIQTIKIGMTRGDLLKLFTVEGGASNRTNRTYVFRECPYIKVDVEFEPVGAPQDKLKGQIEDRIVTISKPYLERSVID